MRTKSSRYRSSRSSESWRGRSRTPRATCEIVDRGGRRGGGRRYWCLRHRADATAKHGVPASACRRAAESPLPPAHEIDLDEFAGGVGLWGAVPAVYDTTRQPLDRGVHIHARRAPGRSKDIDETFRSVRIRGNDVPETGVLVSELDAIYFMVSSVFGFEVDQIHCRHCAAPHLDRDWFCVHPHRRHLCSTCGRYFVEPAPAIANPIVGVRAECRVEVQQPTPSSRSITLDQSDYPGGIQVWGSNPAIVWTGRVPEEEGIHLHAFKELGGEPEIDDTFFHVTLDGIRLGALEVRTLMAQSVLPHLSHRLRSVCCPVCRHPQFDAGQLAFTPRREHECQKCGQRFEVRGRTRNVIANPLVEALETLAARAPRPPQPYGIDLLIEAPGTPHGKSARRSIRANRAP